MKDALTVFLVSSGAIILWAIAYEIVEFIFRRYK